MWVIPDSYPLYSVFAQGMVGSKLDLSELSEELKSSLMWRSKPSLSRTWLTRWNKDSWVRRLFGRILRPSKQDHFEDALILSLADTRASRSVRQGNDSVIKIRDIYGHTLESISKLSDPRWSFSKMLKDISAKGLPKSSPIWKKWRTELSAEYSQRLKSARLTREKECLSWRTPAVQDPGITMDRLYVKPGSRFYDKETGRNAQYGLTQQVQVKNWATPQAFDHVDLVRTPEKLAQTRKEKNAGCMNLREQVHYPDMNRSRNGQPAPEKSSTSGKRRESWPTPNSSDQYNPNIPHDIGKCYLRTEVTDKITPNPTSKLNPNWVEQLMGLPTGWTALDY